MQNWRLPRCHVTWSTWLSVSLSCPRASDGSSLAPLEYLSAAEDVLSSTGSTGSTAAAVLLRFSQPQLGAPCAALRSRSAPHEPSTHGSRVTHPDTRSNKVMQRVIVAKHLLNVHSCCLRSYFRKSHVGGQLTVTLPAPSHCAFRCCSEDPEFWSSMEWTNSVVFICSERLHNNLTGLSVIWNRCRFIIKTSVLAKSVCESWTVCKSRRVYIWQVHIKIYYLDLIMKWF